MEQDVKKKRYRGLRRYESNLSMVNWGREVLDDPKAKIIEEKDEEKKNAEKKVSIFYKVPDRLFKYLIAATARAPEKHGRPPGRGRRQAFPKEYERHAAMRAYWKQLVRDNKAARAEARRQKTAVPELLTSEAAAVMAWDKYHDDATQVLPHMKAGYVSRAQRLPPPRFWYSDE